MSHAPTFIQSAVNPAVQVPMMTPDQFDQVNKWVNNFSKFGPYKESTEPMVGDDADYEKRTQAVLDQYWPGTTDMSMIRGGDSHVYSAMFAGEKVIVKSMNYNKITFDETMNYKIFLNFIAEECQVAYFIEPGVEQGEDLQVTMSLFSSGVEPKALGPDAPWTWIMDEAAVKTNGEWWGKYRTQAIAFSKAHPQVYGNMPAWDTKSNGWQCAIDPVPSIPITRESYGMVHSDAHTGNYFFDYNGPEDYDMTVIDWDNAQKSWYIVDIGTVVWTANMSLVLNHVADAATHLENFESWIMEAYEWPTTHEELEQGCRWRKEFMRTLIEACVLGVPKTDPTYWSCKAYVEMSDNGLIPTC